MLPFSGSCSDLAPSLESKLFGRASVHHLRARDHLFHIGDAGDGFYRLEKGFLTVVLISPEGQERILAILTPGAVVGDLSIVDGLPRSASAVALTECELLFVSRKVFERCASNHPEIYPYLVKMLAARLREADDLIATLAFLSLRGRVIRALLEFAKTVGQKMGKEIIIPRTIGQQDVASMSGVARENVNRVLSDLQRKKIMTKTAKYYRIEDKPRLEQELSAEIFRR
jgi:CRP/FNR family transcriptional regulator, cyclic AMP receptor protein